MNDDLTSVLQIFAKMLTTRIKNLAEIADNLPKNSKNRANLEKEVLKILAIIDRCHAPESMLFLNEMEKNLNKPILH